LLQLLFGLPFSLLSKSISDVVYGDCTAFAYDGVFMLQQVLNYLFIVNHLTDRDKSFMLDNASFVFVSASFK
jgi:hypothetical protein